MKDLSNVSRFGVTADDVGQRIDNFLIRCCKGVPRSHLYRILRSGEVRVNGKRVAPTYRLAQSDELRLPPLRLATPTPRRVKPVEYPVIHEDDDLIVVNKPSGVAVHGGSGISFGVIEALRASRPQESSLELVHRLDRDTSGLLLIAKRRSALISLHAQMRDGAIHKRYLALVIGHWSRRTATISLPLRKFLNRDGERRVTVDHTMGAEAITEFKLEKNYSDFSLLSATLKTGRTHQIRVHLAHSGFPVIGDPKYGIYQRNREELKRGLSRLFLHATELHFLHPRAGQTMHFQCELPEDLQSFIGTLA